MKNWLDTMNRLHAARKAREEFLMREFIDRSIIGPMLLDRLAADLAAGRSRMQTNIRSMQAMTGIADDLYLE
ncbi:MAG TPA: hypothetical protein VFE47_31840 [Tepidisphaeraceae bacterium]|jgi:hypothetical protein|nr:hypothetical protein [Tepidisphaeraceae bacterium]